MGPRTLRSGHPSLRKRCDEHPALLVIPHPRLTERLFVLVPLLELSPLIADPRTRGQGLARAAAELRSVPGQKRVFTFIHRVAILVRRIQNRDTRANWTPNHPSEGSQNVTLASASPLPSPLSWLTAQGAGPSPCRPLRRLSSTSLPALRILCGAYSALAPSPSLIACVTDRASRGIAAGDAESVGLHPPRSRTLSPLARTRAAGRNSWPARE